MTGYFQSLLRQTGFQAAPAPRPAPKEEPLTMESEVLATPPQPKPGPNAPQESHRRRPDRQELQKPAETAAPSAAAPPDDGQPPGEADRRTPPMAIEKRKDRDTPDRPTVSAQPVERETMAPAATPAAAAPPPRHRKPDEAADAAPDALLERAVQAKTPAPPSGKAPTRQAGSPQPDASLKPTRRKNRPTARPTPLTTASASEQAPPVPVRRPVRADQPDRVGSPPPRDAEPTPMTVKGPALIKAAREWVSQTPAPEERPAPPSTTERRAPPHAEPGEPAATIQSRPPLERESTVSIGAINVTVEAPSPQTQIQSQPANPKPATPRRDPFANRLDRHYLRM